MLPADFQFASNAADFQARSQPDIWVPIALDPQKLQRGTHPLRVIARLKPGVELAQAQAELDVIGGEPGATVSGGQPGQGDHGGSAGGAGDGERSRGARDASRRSWTGAADRLRERREPSAEQGSGAPERDGGSGRAGRKPRAAGAATADGEPVSGGHRRDRGLPLRAGCDRGPVSASARRPVACRGDGGRRANAGVHRGDFAGDGNSLRTGSAVRNAARECGGIAEAEQSRCGWNSIRPAERARGGADRDRDRSSDRRRADGEELLGAGARSAGVSFGGHPDRAPVAAAIPLSR